VSPTLSAIAKKTKATTNATAPLKTVTGSCTRHMVWRPNSWGIGEAPMANASAVRAAIAGLVINRVWGFRTSRLDVLRC
jgi:hypothetical protein